MALRWPQLQYLEYELRQWWEQLGIRRWINRHPRVVIAVAAVSLSSLIVGLVWLTWPSRKVEIKSPGEYAWEWYYDLNTGKLFVAEAGLTVPIKAPSGPLPDGSPAGVRAYVLSYKYEPNDSEMFVALLETTDPNARTAGDSRTNDSKSAKPWGQGRLIRRPQDSRWLPANSPEGKLLLRQIFAPDAEGRSPHYCYPD